MKTPFSKKIQQYELLKPQIIKFASKKPYKINDIGEFCSVTGIPLYFVYYYYWKDQGVDEAEKEMLRLLEYYQLEYDL